MRRFNEIIKEVSKLGGISKHNIDKYISLLEEAKENLIIVKDVDVAEVKKQKSKETKELLKRRKKYLKNEERINSLYKYYTDMAPGIKSSSEKIIFEKYYTCRLERIPSINEKYNELFSKYFVNIDGECHLILSNKLVPIIVQKMDEEEKDLISGKKIVNLSCNEASITPIQLISRGTLVDKLKIMNNDDIGIYISKMQEFNQALDRLKYQDYEKESVLRLNN